MSVVKWVEKIEFIKNNFSKNINNTEASYLNLIYRKVLNRTQALKEKNEVLQNEMFLKEQLETKRLELQLLGELLGNYLYQKGLKQSLLKTEEMLNMIHTDRQKAKDDLEEKNFTIEGIKKMLESINGGKDDGEVKENR